MLSPEACQRLLATEANPERLWPLVQRVRAATIDLDDIESSDALTPAERKRAATADMDALSAALKMGVVTVSGDELPDHFRRDDVPPALFADGDIQALMRPSVGIVGTRRASGYGRAVAAQFAAALSQAGCTIVSGGAIGIDEAVHVATLECGGQSACVLPCGIDVVYPARHRALFDRIRRQGCLLSQFACGSEEQSHRLVMRNRTLAALCQALLVVEAPTDSGALMTATAAREYGRPVFVVPGPVNQDTFCGSHDLIRSGAELAAAPIHVLNALGLAEADRAVRRNATWKESEQAVMTALEGLPLPVESIAQATGLSPAEVMVALTLLEIEGVVLRTSEGYALKP